MCFRRKRGSEAHSTLNKLGMLEMTKQGAGVSSANGRSRMSSRTLSNNWGHCLEYDGRQNLAQGNFSWKWTFSSQTFKWHLFSRRTCGISFFLIRQSRVSYQRVCWTEGLGGPCGRGSMSACCIRSRCELKTLVEYFLVESLWICCTDGKTF